MATLWSFSGQQVRDLNGRAYPGAKAYFYDAGTTTDRSVYQDGALTTRHSQPVTADSQGRFPAVYMPVGLYRFRVVTAQDVSLGIDFDEITGAVTELEASGSVDINTTFQTGWPLFLEQTGPLTGFVRDNGRTVGSAASGATERANADVEDLYAWYWEKFSDSICAVVTGRGASAAADFASNKAIATLDKRGVAGYGLDDMGNSARNMVQVTRNLTTTFGLRTATVSDISGIAVGMCVSLTPYVAAGTTVTALVYPATVELSVNAVSTGVAATRFSPFRDAQTPGYTTGAVYKYIAEQELAVITPSGTITVTQGTVPAPANLFNDVGAGAFSTSWTNTGLTFPTTGVSATFAGTPFGSGHPIMIMPPGVLGSWYRKL